MERRLKGSAARKTSKRKSCYRGAIWTEKLAGIESKSRGSAVARRKKKAARPGTSERAA
jgi:hypothetical protein